MIVSICVELHGLKRQMLKIADAINEAYKKPGTYENLFWDDIVNQQIMNIDLTVHEVFDNQIVEIDTVKELTMVDPNYKEYN